MEPTLQFMPARQVIGLGAKFKSILSPDRNNFIIIPKLWHEFINRQDEIQNRSNEGALGCVYCLEGEHELYYLACVEVTAVDSIPEGMEHREIPAGNHAIFIHKGSLENLGETMAYIHGAWLRNSGHQHRDAPETEVYGDKFDPDSEESELEICIPII